MGQKERLDDSSPAHRRINTVSVLEGSRGQRGRRAHDQGHGGPELWSDGVGCESRGGTVSLHCQRQELRLTQCCDLNVSASVLRILDLVAATRSHLRILVGHLPVPQ